MKTVITSTFFMKGIMMKTNNKNMFVADFETTTYPGQTNTEVWAAAFVRLWTDEVTIVNNIEDFIRFFEGQTENSICYFHNLKFDGMFILSYLATNKKYKHTNRIRNMYGMWKKKS